MQVVKTMRLGMLSAGIVMQISDSIYIILEVSNKYYAYIGREMFGKIDMNLEFLTEKLVFFY